jgi:hypothetical protein
MFCMQVYGPAQLSDLNLPACGASGNKIHLFYTEIVNSYSQHLYHQRRMLTHCTLADTISITSQLIRRLPMIVKKTNS